MSLRVFVAVVTLGVVVAGSVSDRTKASIHEASRHWSSIVSIDRRNAVPSEEEQMGAVRVRDLFIRAAATTQQAYQNEQVVVEYHLFYHPDIRLRHSRLADAWDAPGFWREELDVPPRPIPRTRRVGGQVYKTIVLKRVALFPTRPGTLRVDPLRVEAEAQGTIEVRGATVRGRFKPVKLASDSLRVSVRSLPPAAPASFDGAVGRFSMTAQMETDSAAVGDPVQLTVQVQGVGNLATLSPPNLTVPSAFEVYDPVVQTDMDRGGRQIRGDKTFAYTLVPRSSGTYTLPPVVFSYFHPEDERYRTIRSGPSTLHVTGEAPPRAVGRTGDGLPVGTITDLMEAEAARWVRADRRPLYRRLWIYLALLIPVMATGGGIAYRRWKKESGMTEARDPADARDPVQKHLRRARKHHQKSVDLAFYDALEQALRTFLDERLSLNGISASQAAIDRRLARHGVPTSLRESLSNLLDRCRESQFASNSDPPESADVVLKEAQTLLRRLDDVLPTTASTKSQL